jgi:hypothetical protein
VNLSPPIADLRMFLSAKRRMYVNSVVSMIPPRVPSPPLADCYPLSVPQILNAGADPHLSTQGNSMKKQDSNGQ